MADEISKVQVYKGKNLGDLFREIHVNVIVKQGKIEELIMTLMPLVKTANDAQQIVPLIKDYLDVGVKNDELLVKVAAIVQRYASSTAKSDDEGFLSDEVRQQLINEANDVVKESKDIIKKAEN